MEIAAFIVAVVAFVVFAFDHYKTKALLPLGLALLTAAWVVELVVQSGTTVVIR